MGRIRQPDVTSVSGSGSGAVELKGKALVVLNLPMVERVRPRLRPLQPLTADPRQSPTPVGRLTPPIFHPAATGARLLLTPNWK